MSDDLNEDTAADEPIRQWTKVVTVLDCVPARADTPGTGEKVVMVTLEHDGDIEPTLLLNLPDAHKLAVSLLSVLAHHGDDNCRRAVEQYFGAEGDE